MVVTEVSSQSWFGRIGESIKGVLFGLLLFVVAFPVLFWNEGRAVKRAKTLAEGQGAVQRNVPAEKVDPAMDGKLVHMQGEATSSETLTDDLFTSVSADNVIKLERVVEMYQWQERQESKTRKKLGGGTETVKTYTYNKTWSTSPIDSSKFHPDGASEYGRGNPPMPYQSGSQAAGVVSLGAFRLNPGLVSRINAWTPLAVDQAALDALPAETSAKLKLSNNGFYQGANPASPAIGDLRVTFQVVKPTRVSIIAEQTGETFQPYQAKTVAGSLELLEIGDKSADEMFALEVSRNNTLTWILRGVGFVVMALGIGLVFRPITVFADVIPLFGNILGAGIGIFAFVTAAMFSLITIAIAWVFYRPVLGICLIVVGVGIVVGAMMIFRNRKNTENLESVVELE